MYSELILSGGYYHPHFLKQAIKHLAFLEVLDWRFKPCVLRNNYWPGCSATIIVPCDRRSVNLFSSGGRE